MNTKGGFELSVSFLVKLILGMVMLGMGVLLFTTIFDKAETYELTVSEQTRAELLQVMNTGQPVVVLDQTVAITNKQAALFSLGINNKYPQPRTFSITIGNPQPTNFDIRYLQSSTPLDPQKDYYTNIVIQPIKTAPPAKGQYSFIVSVTCTDCPPDKQEYDKKQLLVTIR